VKKQNGTESKTRTLGEYQNRNHNKKLRRSHGIRIKPDRMNQETGRGRLRRKWMEQI